MRISQHEICMSANAASMSIYMYLIRKHAQIHLDATQERKRCKLTAVHKTYNHQLHRASYRPDLTSNVEFSINMCLPIHHIRKTYSFIHSTEHEVTRRVLPEHVSNAALCICTHSIIMASGSTFAMATLGGPERFLLGF